MLFRSPLAQRDTALDAVLKMPAWSHLGPLKRLRPLWRELRRPKHRLRKADVETLKDGSFGKNPQREGPIKLESRAWALGEVLAIQAGINATAVATGRERIDILSAEEEARIRELIAAETWPDGWEGNEPGAEVLLDKVYVLHGKRVVQPRLLGLEDSDE